MFTVAEFLSKFEKYTDEELYNIHLNIDGYSEEAKEAVNIATEKRGGLEKLTDHLKQKQNIENEKERIKQETVKLSVPGTELSFLKKMILSDILTPDETNEIIEKQFAEVKLEEEDKKIKPRTIWGSIIGGGVASIIGGVLWGLQMIQMHRIFFIFLIGLIILCYGIINFLTKQSKRNNAVFVATIVSVVCALLIGQLLFEIFGNLNQ